MMTNSVNRAMTIALVLLTIAVSAVTIISIWQSKRIKEFNAEITRFEENRYLMQQLTTAVLDNETGARGFVITGKRSFLEPMISSERKLDELRIILTKQTTIPEAVSLLNDSLSPLIDLRKEFSWQMVALVNSGKNEEAKKLVLSGVGKGYTDEARRIAAKIDTIRTNMLYEKRTGNDTFIQNLNSFLITILIIIFITSVFNFRQLANIYKRQKQTETQLRQNEQLFAALFYKSPIVKWIVAPATNTIVDVNDSFCNFFNLNREEIIGKTTVETGLSNSPEIRESVTRQLKEKGFVRDLEYKVIRKNGEERWVSMNIDPIQLNGETCIVGASTDITTIKKNEELVAHMNTQLEQKVKEKTAELRQNEKKLKALNESLEHIVKQRTEQLTKANKEMEAFSYSVSHDLRAPLRGIIGFTNIIQEDFGDSMQEEEKRLFAVIKKNTEKMGNLIDDLLDFSRLGRKEISKTIFETEEMVKEVIEDLCRINPNTDAIVWNIGSLPAVQADISTIRQVWTNLISNAIKYSKTNVKPSIEIGSFKEQEQTVFFVKDNGVGFDEKYKDKLFKVFQRLHSENEFEGTGIGLALVEKIISRHDGKVWATGKPNNGATFFFSIP